MTIEGTNEVQLIAGIESAFELVSPPHRRAWFRQLMRRPGPLLAQVYLTLLALAAIFAPLVAPYDPIEQDIPNRLAGPSWSHLLGTDDLGRDFLSRLIYGARVSLAVCLAVVAIAMAVALVVGLISGYAGGRTDNILMRINDGG